MLGKQVRHERAQQEIIAACWQLARTKGLLGFSLKDVASAVGVQAPSLYSYFASKNAMYDAMFAAGNRAFLERMRAVPTGGSPRDTLLAAATAFVGFCVEDPVRHQLLFERTIPGFTPSPAAYAIAVQVVTLMRDGFAALGIRDPAHLDIWTALVSGLAAQQLANEPGGDRWSGRVAASVEMFADFVFKD
ncbi:TetR/AcrR family transcriptional regulator [Rathayibacter soli]|uniref:TetR/AcrR family transcriptional regulator n=1 Tax=Rathayibacter soli TaxID=3144168 RepID=UPI0027E54FF3|nr:TetR/AcrR family transcriptional regulator [Glaciibacter superstes]